MLCPNNLAASTLVTTDCYSVLFLLLSMYLCWKFLRDPSWKYFLLLALAMALSQLAKQSLFHLYFLIPICLLAGYRSFKLKIRPGFFLAGVLLFLGVQWIILNSAFYFYRTNLEIGQYQFKSRFFESIQKIIPSALPVPFPKPFVEGLDQAKYYDQIGGGDTSRSSFGKTTILGHSSTGGGFWYYYLVALGFKTPISYFVFLGWSLYYLFKNSKLREFMQKEFFLLAPVIYYLVLMSFFYNTQNGLRHIIFIYPFLFILSGNLIRNTQSIYPRCLVTALLVYLFLSDFKYRNNYYSYTNELITDKTTAYRFVGSNNLYFGQAKFFLEEYLKQHPGIRPVPKTPQAGTFVISVPDYLDIWNLHQYDWLTRFKPVGQVAYAYLLVRVEDRDLPH
jgi:hypothetical protein